ncbi:MAG: hypothetical protein INR69_05985 [Mucilaginibacter polytrichastri]|nr:hypothetical protein [Mucilaginibacter polytrichastri]
MASSDIQPQNGVVHVLAWGGFVNGGVITDFESNFIGFNYPEFYQDVYQTR